MITMRMCGARRIEVLLIEVFHKLDKIMSALDDLKAEVAATVSVEQSAVTLITGIAAQLQAALSAAANPDPAIVDLTNQLTAGASALAAALTANTPVTAPPPAAPAPAEPAPAPTDTGAQTATAPDPTPPDPSAP